MSNLEKVRQSGPLYDSTNHFYHFSVSLSMFEQKQHKEKYESIDELYVNLVRCVEVLDNPLQVKNLCVCSIEMVKNEKMVVVGLCSDFDM